MRICIPSSIPAGMETERFFVVRTRPAPWQVVHGSVISTPSPPQRSQAVAVMNWPRIVFCIRRIWPLPEHFGQVSGCLPPSMRVPWQEGQVSCCVKEISFSAPKTASAKESVAIVRRSSPRIGAPGAAPPRPLPPKNESKMSLKSKPPPNGLPPAPPFTPACPKRSYAARLSSSDSTSYASLTSLNCSSAPGS